MRRNTAQLPRFTGPLVKGNASATPILIREIKTMPGKRSFKRRGRTEILPDAVGAHVLHSGFKQTSRWRRRSEHWHLGIKFQTAESWQKAWQKVYPTCRIKAYNKSAYPPSHNAAAHHKSEVGLSRFAGDDVIMGAPFKSEYQEWKAEEPQPSSVHYSVFVNSEQRCAFHRLLAAFQVFYFVVSLFFGLFLCSHW